MILKGNRRGGGMQMALHLLNAEDNEHVTIHEMRGFISDSLTEALTETYAISRGTRCKNFLYSLSLSPPEMESVPVEVFEKAINDIEEKLGFANQPRAIVFHEKDGRRHAHCIWSRIDVEEMKAIDPSYDKLQLRDMSRELYLEHGWKMPRGLMNSKECDPLNFTQAEWQQAKRAKQDPRAIKQAFQDCWAISDSRTAFANALEERGYYLASGDRRGFVAVDWRGEVFAISRWVGVKAKDVRARLGSPDELPSVEKTQQQLAEKLTDKLQKFVNEATSSHDKAEIRLKQNRQVLASRH
ncbi:MAG TPA: relaxase, partial [Devosia sp.]|nr:relaxase [Devosia sp.]